MCGGNSSKRGPKSEWPTTTGLEGKSNAAQAKNRDEAPVGSRGGNNRGLPAGLLRPAKNKLAARFAYVSSPAEPSNVGTMTED